MLLRFWVTHNQIRSPCVLGTCEEGLRLISLNHFQPCRASLAREGAFSLFLRAAPKCDLRANPLDHIIIHDLSGLQGTYTPSAVQQFCHKARLATVCGNLRDKSNCSGVDHRQCDDCFISSLNYKM